MSYIDGFVAAVPQEDKQAYLDHALRRGPCSRTTARRAWWKIGEMTCRRARSLTSTARCKRRMALTVLCPTLKAAQTSCKARSPCRTGVDLIALKAEIVHVRID
jgi:hypothetical protein